MKGRIRGWIHTVVTGVLTFVIIIMILFLFTAIGG